MPQHATSDDRHDRGAHLRTKQSIGGRRSGSGQCKSATSPEDARQNMQQGVSPRLYRSSRRTVTAERTRARLLKAASAMLAAPDGISLDAVARRAGVTRLTVYNQFGSRRALLEAVFDDMAERGGLHRIH